MDIYTEAGKEKSQTWCNIHYSGKFSILTQSRIFLQFGPKIPLCGTYAFTRMMDVLMRTPGIRG